jgi:hypothetical protein
MTNSVRGEVDIRLGEATYTVALTLGTFAAIEEAFGVASFEEAFTSILGSGSGSARALQTFLKALLKGNAIAVTPDIEKDILLLTLPETMSMVQRIFDASGLMQKKETTPNNPPLSDESGGSSG